MDTMNIQNRALAGASLSTPEGLSVGDAQGVFVVPRALGEKLIVTPGWHEVAVAPVVVVVDPVAGLRAAMAPEPEAVEVEVNVDTKSPIDLSGLSHSELLALASEQGLVIGKAQKRMGVDELRDYVAQQGGQP